MESRKKVETYGVSGTGLLVCRNDEEKCWRLHSACLQSQKRWDKGDGRQMMIKLLESPAAYCPEI